MIVGAVIGSSATYFLVPRGDPELLTEYEQQISQFESMVDQYEYRIDELESKLSSEEELENQLDELREQVDILQVQLEETQEDLRSEFQVWWDEYRKPLTSDYSSYPAFLRGAYAQRIDEARSYLMNADLLRGAGIDSILLAVDLVLDPGTGMPYTPAEEVFTFYVQAFKRAGFRVLLVADPCHPNLDLGEGFAWEPGMEGRYQPSPELLGRFDGAVVHIAEMAEEYGVYAFLPCIEPYKMSRDVGATSDWLQSVQVEIREVYGGKVGATDIMFDIGKGYSEPFPYDYSGFDLILGGPPAGRKDAESWESVIDVYIGKGVEYAQDYGAEGFGFYEWGGYQGGVWFEPIWEDQQLDDQEALEILEAGIRQGQGRLTYSFPRCSVGWVDLDKPTFQALSDWYLSMGDPVEPVIRESWTYEELVVVEEALAGFEDAYRQIFMIDGPYPWPH